MSCKHLSSGIDPSFYACGKTRKWVKRQLNKLNRRQRKKLDRDEAADRHISRANP